ncbi:MAG TPA: DUF4292 domain-containing protein [Edaphocola sp.]|nr:DUF4292 domain-containing protein [Edaphocola sp.]
MSSARFVPSKILLFLAVAAAFIGFSACNVHKKIAEKPLEEMTGTSEVQKPDVYLKHRLAYKTFMGKGALHLVTADKDQNLNLVINMNRDKDIMGSVRAMGLLEVARAYATPDSLFALNRLSRTAYELGFEQGTALLQAQIPFAALQSLFTGSPLMPETAPVTGVNVKDSVISITQQKDSFVQVLNYSLSTQVLESLSLRALNKPFSCIINFSNYRKIGIGQPFAYDRTIDIDDNGKKISIGLSFEQAMIDVPVNTSFRVPGSYKVIRKI